MSFIKTLKGTFKNVQEDLSEGLKTLSTSQEKLKDVDAPVKPRQKINWDAGAKILDKNELMWKDLYQYSEATSVRAKDVDIAIGELYVYCDKQSEILMKLHNEAANLPTLLKQLQDITDSLALVEDECSKVEAALVHLENACEEQEYNRNVTSHHRQLAVYKMKKEHELQSYRVQLARQHAEKVENRNRKQQHLILEKQQAYEDQFEKDVDFYKKHGKPGRTASTSTSDSDKKLDVGEIEIEEDTSALDKFLEGTEDSPTTETDTLHKESTTGPQGADVSENLDDPTVKTDNIDHAGEEESSAITEASEEEKKEDSENTNVPSETVEQSEEEVKEAET